MDAIAAMLQRRDLRRVIDSQIDFRSSPSLPPHSLNIVIATLLNRVSRADNTDYRNIDLFDSRAVFEFLSMPMSP